MNSARCFVVAGALWISMICLPSGASAAEPSTQLANAKIVDIDGNYTSFTVKDCPNACDGKSLVVTVRDTGAQKELKTFKTGDHVTIQFTQENEQSVLQTISIRTVPVSSAMRLEVLALTASALFLLTLVLSKLHPLRYIRGQDNRYSDSKFQMAVWFFVVVVTYVAAVYLRATAAGRDFLSGVNIPQNLLLLSGMSALSFAGAKGITTSKVERAVERGLVNPKPSAAAPSFWNLVQDDEGNFDVGDFQMLVVTLLAVGMYLVLVFDFLGSVEMRKTIDLPNLDTTILAAFGLGQGAYLAKKAAGTPGQS